MQRLDLSFRQVTMMIPHRYTAACTGFVYRSASLPSWYTSVSVDLDRPTWPTPFNRSPRFPVDNACGHCRRRHWMSRLYTTVHCRRPSVLCPSACDCELYIWGVPLTAPFLLRRPPAPAPLRSKARFKGGGQGPRSPHQQRASYTPADFLSLAVAGRYMRRMRDS